MAKAIKRFMALFLTAIMAVAVLPKLPEGISVTAFAAGNKWDSTFDNNSCSVISIDKNVYYSNSGYSIKITNNSYNAAGVKKTFSVKKNSHYRATVMTKYSGYSRASASWRENSGAFLVGSYSTDEYNHSSAWKKLTYEFDTGNSTTYTLTLQNGISDSKCKGTAWFSDFKLEEAENVSSK